jgi:hypothetical protein
MQGNVNQLNSVTPAILAARGLSLSKSSDLTLLNSQIGSPAVRAAGFALPFANYPPSTSLTNALRPFPQYGTLNPTSSNGNSWYDSLQMKLNARLKHNITVLGTYTWAKSLTRIATFDNWTAFDTQKVLDVNSIPQALSLNMITRHRTWNQVSWAATGSPGKCSAIGRSAACCVTRAAL